MPEQATKKEWTEPELIVLVRNKPEEAVLLNCKIGGKDSTGPSGAWWFCAGPIEGYFCTGTCVDPVAS